MRCNDKLHVAEKGGRQYMWTIVLQDCESLIGFLSFISHHRKVKFCMGIGKHIFNVILVTVMPHCFGPEPIYYLQPFVTVKQKYTDCERVWHSCMAWKKDVTKTYQREGISNQCAKIGLQEGESLTVF